MLFCIEPTGAPDPKSVVDDVHLPTNGLLQLKFEEVCQISQISNPLAAVRDTITLEDQKSDMISLYLFFVWSNWYFIGYYACVL